MKCSIGSSFLVWKFTTFFAMLGVTITKRLFSHDQSELSVLKSIYFGGCVCVLSSDLKYAFNGLPRIFTEGFSHY